MTSKISRENARELLAYTEMNGGGVPREKIIRYIENLNESPLDVLEYLLKLNYLTQVYENTGDDFVEVIFVITPEGRDFLTSSLTLL